MNRIGAGRGWLRSILLPWRLSLRRDWPAVRLPAAHAPLWPETCMKCGLRRATGTMRVKVRVPDPYDRRRTIAGVRRYRAPMCRFCRVWRVFATLGVVAVAARWVGAPRGALWREPWQEWGVIHIDTLGNLLGSVALVVLALPLVLLSFGRAVHVTECGDHVRFEFRTEDLAREFAACNQGAVLTAP